MTVLDTSTSDPTGAGAPRSESSDGSQRGVTAGRTRPAGLAPGAVTFAAAWLVGLAIVRLTGAAAVVLLLVAAAVALFGASLSGWWRLRGLAITDVSAGSVVIVDDTTTFVVTHVDRGRSSARVDVSLHGATAPLDPSGTTLLDVSFGDAGIVDHVDVTLRSAGAPGLVWWRRRARVAIEPLHVAPLADGADLPVTRGSSTDAGDSAGGRGQRIGDLDGTRPWRPGEGQQSIHWPSTLRSGEIITYERSPSTEVRWVLSLDDPAHRLRRTMEDGLRHGHEVLVAVDAERTEPIRHRHDVLHWSAVSAQRQRAPEPEPARLTLWRQQLSLPIERDTDPSVPIGARLLTALAAILALNMLGGALGASLSSRIAITVGIGITTALSGWAAAGRRTLWIRALIALIAFGALGRIAVQASGVGGLLEALRGPMPDLLLLLVALHGAEVVDRRTNRVHLSITAVVVAYAAGLRIDGNVGWWLLAWGLVAIASMTTLDAETTGRRIRALPIIGWSAAGLAATIGVAAFVPIPDGPASLGLPSLSPSDAVVDSSGALLGADGRPPAQTPPGEAPVRGALGQAGGYPGFSNTLDTAVRGNLGDEVVMRVRAPEPAFWRGQIFTEFDGRTWTVTPEQGRLVDGPQIRVRPTVGDLPMDGVPTSEFVQTYTVESDLPNVIFGAGRPETVIFDGSVFTRSDGALRADRTLTDGTVYSVVSQRVDVTAEGLRAQGDLGERFEPFATDPDVARFLGIPESTSQATLDLAADLRVPGSTYDTIRAYEAWMALNTEYDLDAPVPDGDAVDDFLFGAQRGFCEQIASSLVVMLRSQGVPARLATGYIPGDRDRISGVFEVRASDAHAWVEVWFPETGWEAFDPTADVPLAGDADRSTVGADAASAIIDGALSRPLESAAVVATFGALLAAIRGVAEFRRRRKRGRWGLLHDRFMALAPDTVTAPAAAAHLMEMLGPHTFGPHEVAETLDRVAFDPDHTPTADDRRRVGSDIASLEREVRRHRPTQFGSRTSTSASS